MNAILLKQNRRPWFKYLYFTIHIDLAFSGNHIDELFSIRVRMGRLYCFTRGYPHNTRSKKFRLQAFCISNPSQISARHLNFWHL